MTATRERITDSNGDLEYGYECSCGFRDYASSTCNCPSCKRYVAGPGLPLSKCPKCDEPFVDITNAPVVSDAAVVVNATDDATSSVVDNTPSTP